LQGLPSLVNVVLHLVKAQFILLIVLVFDFIYTQKSSELISNVPSGTLTSTGGKRNSFIQIIVSFRERIFLELLSVEVLEFVLADEIFDVTVNDFIRFDRAFEDKLVSFSFVFLHQFFFFSQFNHQIFNFLLT
jgi:hypothetical protein